MLGMIYLKFFGPTECTQENVGHPRPNAQQAATFGYKRLLELLR
jgi:hypothetical protein